MVALRATLTLTRNLESREQNSGCLFCFLAVCRLNFKGLNRLITIRLVCLREDLFAVLLSSSILIIRSSYNIIDLCESEYAITINFDGNRN